MDVIFLLVVAASGLRGVSSLPDRLYHFVYEPKSWTEALSYCREKHTDLVSVTNMEEVNKLNSMVDMSRMTDYYGYQAWIGLHFEKKSSWAWSMDNDFQTQTNWNSGEPTTSTTEFCGGMTESGEWFDLNCFTKLKAICCDVRGANVTYSYINMWMTWFEAQRYCRENHTDLASVRNSEENQKIQELVPEGESVWTGLHRAWRWTDGHHSSFRNWDEAGKEPNGAGNEDCVAMNFNLSGRFHDWDCHTRKDFICYSAISNKVTLRLKLVKDSSLDLKDSAVMEDMLQQLKQKLKQQGVNGDLRLSWRTQSDGDVFHKDEAARTRAL